MVEKMKAPLNQVEFPPEVEQDMRDLLMRVGREFWGREELPESTRSLVTMAILCAHGHQEELAVHVRMGLELFGVSRAEICEVIRHCTLYSGAPAAVSGFRTVSRVFKEMDEEQ